MANILIVDDEAGITRIIEQQLTDEGHSCVICHQGLEAFKAAVRENIDLIVTDVMMPHWTGRDFAGALEISKKDIKIIVITGYSQDEITQELSDMKNVVGILPKPWERNELLTLVRQNT